MWASWAVTTAPATEPITLDEAKDWLKVDDTADNDLITALITATREWAEELSGRKLITQTITENLDEWPNSSYRNRRGEILLSVAPVQSVTSIRYYDENGTQQTLSSSRYIVDTRTDPTRIALKSDFSWPTLENRISAIEIIYVAGYGSASAIPEGIKTAMKLYLGNLYERRTNDPQSPFTVKNSVAERLLGFFRIKTY